MSSTKELDELSSIERYIEVLIDKFPNAITQTELAKETSVTKSAVSKIRDRLITLCDLKALAHKKKFLLSSDYETLQRLFLFFFLRMKLELILKSNYLKKLIEKWNVHEKLAKALETLSYSDFFNKNDTDIFIKIILYNLSNIRLPQIYSHSEIRKTSMNEVGLLMRIIAYFPLLEDFPSKVDLAIFDNEEELLHLLTLRDKIFDFIMYNSEKILKNWEVVTNMKEDDKKSVYVEAYLHAIDHYARKYANQFNNAVATRAKEKKIIFRDQDFEIGKFFKHHQNEIQT